MWIGDVGQGAFEEIDFVPAGTGGYNFGWKRFEGFGLRPGEPATGGTAITIGTLTPPITDMSSGTGDHSVTGGFVYRGSRFPRMQGRYIYGDYVSTRIYGIQKNDAGAWQRTTLIPNSGMAVSSWGEDEAGELYLVRLQSGGANTGHIYNVRDSRDAGYLTVSNISRNDTNGRVSFTFGTALNKTYQVQVSTDLQNWTALGPPIASTGYEALFAESADPPADAVRRYFRVVEN
jgi:hypothetical protein